MSDMQYNNDTISNDNKKVFLYDEKIERIIEKSYRTKLIMKLIILTLVEIICGAYWFSDFLDSIISVLAFIMFFVFIFPWMYYFMNTFLELVGGQGVFGDRCYIIVNDKFLSLKFGRKYVMHNTHQKNALMSLIDFSIINYSTELDNERIKRTVLNSDEINIDDLLSYIEVVNVYNIKEFYNRYEVRCDYIEKIEENSCTNRTISIYKYYNNHQEMYDYLCNLKNKSKKEIKDSTRNKKLLKIFLKTYKNQKEVYILPISLIIYYLVTSPKEIFYVFLILTFLFLGYVIITYNILKIAETEDEKNVIVKSLKIDTVITIVLFISSIVSSIIYGIDIKNVVLFYLILGIFVAIIVLRFKRSDRK